MSRLAQSSSELAYSGVKPVEDRHRINEMRLANWLEANVEGYEGPLTVQQFKGGQSNPTYRLETPRCAYVLRRKPFGNLLPSAHAVDREFRVITALHAHGFPVPKAYALCTDDSVIGAAFFVMALVEGRVIWNGAIPDETPERRQALYSDMVDTLAKLHSFDPASIGLGDYGKQGNYYVRQIDRWSKQYRASETGKIEAMDCLIEWLPRTVPAQERISVVHGDYRIDNMIVEPNGTRVLAVLDWELSTLGDPLADLTYLLTNWVLPSDGRAGLSGLELPALGIPTIEDVVARYCQLTGRIAIPDLNWHFAYNLFRLAAILQGIAGRIRDGTAASARAQESVKRIPMLSSKGWEFAKNYESENSLRHGSVVRNIY